MKTLVILFICLIGNQAFSQHTEVESYKDPTKYSDFALRDLMDKTEKGREKYSTIEGSPYWIDQWSKGTVTAVTGHTLNRDYAID